MAILSLAPALNWEASQISKNLTSFSLESCNLLFKVIISGLEVLLFSCIGRDLLHLYSPGCKIQVNMGPLNVLYERLTMTVLF